MVTLHILTEEMRAILKWGGTILVVIVLISLFTGLGKRVKEFFAPTPPPPPTVAFGVLPRIQFPPSVSEKKFTYSINTLTGTLPSFEDRAKVYKLKKSQPDLLSLNRAKDTVANIGLTDQETKITPAIYEWTENVTPFRTLDLNIFNYDFTLTSQYLSDEPIIHGENAPNEQEALRVADEFLSSLSIPTDSIDNEKTKTTIYSIVNGMLQPATSLSTTQVIRVDFFYKDLDKLPIYHSNHPHSTNYAYVSGGEDESQVVDARFIGLELDKSETYPIKTAGDAFKELENGKAFIATAAARGTEVQIENVFLAYFSEGKSQDYLLPIIVFEGEGFIAYVSAVANQWIE